MPKTATIKIRLSEDEKQNWELQADADGVSLSSLIRRRMNHPTTRADGVLETAPKVTQGCPANGKPCNCSGLCRRPVGVNPLPLGTGIQASPYTFPTIPPGVTGISRTGGCLHGRPQYVFCSTCDA